VEEFKVKIEGQPGSNESKLFFMIISKLFEQNLGNFLVDRMLIIILKYQLTFKKWLNNKGLKRLIEKLFIKKQMFANLNVMFCNLNILIFICILMFEL
jgi:hypothetical protein